MAVFFRFFSVVLAVHLMLYTTPPVELALTITERGKRRFSQADLLSILAIILVMLVSFMPVFLNQKAPAAFLGGLNPTVRDKQMKTGVNKRY